MHNEGKYELSEAEKFYILETSIGEFDLYEGEEVPVDFPMLVENLEETGVNVLGVVLNDLPQKKAPGYYYSGYYGYGYFRYKYYNKYYGKEKKSEA